MDRNLVLFIPGDDVGSISSTDHCLFVLKDMISEL